MQWRSDPDITVGIQKRSHTHLCVPNHLRLQSGSLTLLAWAVWLEEIWLVAARLLHAPPFSLSHTMRRAMKRSMRELIFCLTNCSFLDKPCTFLVGFSECSFTPMQGDSNLISESTFKNELTSLQYQVSYRAEH